MAENNYNKIEKERHKQAFEYFYALGSRRKYRLVANKYQVSVSTIKNWARDFRWQQRIEEREAENTKVLAEKTRIKDADIREGFIKLLELIQVKGAKDLVAGRSRSTPNNMIKAIEATLRMLDKKQEDTEAEGKPAANLPKVVMYDNGRGDCTLPGATEPNAKTEDESEEPEKEDNE